MQSDQKCIWMASYPKSGNTWARIFIHNLQRVMDGEGEEPQNINRLSEQTDWEFRPRDYDKVLGKPAVDATPEEIAHARYQVQTNLARSKSAPFLVKTHNALANVAGFPTINMDVTLAAVYLVRNPLDVAISYAQHCDASVDYIIGTMAEADVFKPYSRNMVHNLSPTPNPTSPNTLQFCNLLPI